MLEHTGQKQIWDILQCAECKRYVEKETGRIVPKPSEGKIMSHTVCHDCLPKVNARLEAEAEAIETERVEVMLGKVLRSADPPAEVADRIRNNTLNYMTNNGGK